MQATNTVIENSKVIKNRLQAGLALTLAALLNFTLTACNQSGQDGQHKRDIKPAVKLSTDASHIAQQTYQFLVSAEPLLTTQPVNLNQLEQEIFQPVRQLLLRWNTEVKQSDSVVGDQYTICRGALISLDSWARSIQKQIPGQADKQAIFEKQKNLCQHVIHNPAQQS